MQELEEKILSKIMLYVILISIIIKNHSDLEASVLFYFIYLVLLQKKTM